MTDRECLLGELDKTVADAATFFTTADDDLFDGHLTAREVLSHLVFWHREVVAVCKALAEKRSPELRSGTFAQLNAAAACEFQDCPLQEMAGKLLLLQKELKRVSGCLPDWQMPFAIKRGGRRKSLTARLLAIEAHIRNHTRRLCRAKRLGEAWVQAYYSAELGKVSDERNSKRLPEK